MSHVESYFACANTGKGFANYFASNLQGLQKIFLLKGGPGTGKSTLMKKVGSHFEQQGYDIELIYCSSDVESLDGVIVRSLGVAIVDATAPHVIEPTAPGALEEYINLGTAWDTMALKQHRDEILVINHSIKECYKKVYEVFALALKIHDEWEKIYIGEMDYHQMNELTKEVVTTLFEQKSREKDSKIMDRFFGGATYKGPLDFVEDITKNIRNRYLIKGRPGTGKSTMLKKIRNEAISRGIDVTVYHCGFDPDSLDMLVFPELSVCIFDSTAPHEYDVSREEDIVIDVYARSITPGTDEKYAKGLSDIRQRYQQCITEGVSYLKKAKQLHDNLETFYIKATNFKVIDEITNNLIERIEQEAK